MISVTTNRDLYYFSYGFNTLLQKVIGTNITFHYNLHFVLF